MFIGGDTESEYKNVIKIGRNVDTEIKAPTRESTEFSNTGRIRSGSYSLQQLIVIPKTKKTRSVSILDLTLFAYPTFAS